MVVALWRWLCDPGLFCRPESESNAQVPSPMHVKSTRACAVGSLSVQRNHRHFRHSGRESPLSFVCCFIFNDTAIARHFFFFWKGRKAKAAGRVAFCWAGSCSSVWGRYSRSGAATAIRPVMASTPTWLGVRGPSRWSALSKTLSPFPSQKKSNRRDLRSPSSSSSLSSQ